MRGLKFILFGFISFACFGLAENPDSLMEEFPSNHLKRKVPISLHVPAAKVLKEWKVTHPDVRGRLIRIFFPVPMTVPRI